MCDIASSGYTMIVRERRGCGGAWWWRVPYSSGTITPELKSRTMPIRMRVASINSGWVAVTVISGGGLLRLHPYNRLNVCLFVRRGGGRRSLREKRARLNHCELGEFV